MSTTTVTGAIAAPLPAAATPAATIAMSQLAGQVDAANTARLLKYLSAAIPQMLNVSADCVAITMEAGDDTIGIAAQSKRGNNAATSGAKSDCIANQKQWATDRCAEISAQWAPADAAAKAAVIGAVS